MRHSLLQEPPYNDSVILLLAALGLGQPTPSLVLEPQIGHVGNICDMAFSADGNTLYSAGGDGKIVVWDVPSRRQRGEATNFMGAVGGLSLSPDGNELAANETWIDNRGFLISTKDLSKRTQVADSHVKQSWNTTGRIRFSPDGKTIAREYGHEVISLYDSNGAHIRDLAPPHGISTFGFQANDSILAANNELKFGGPKFGLEEVNTWVSLLDISTAKPVWMVELNHCELLSQANTGDKIALICTSEAQAKEDLDRSKSDLTYLATKGRELKVLRASDGNTLVEQNLPDGAETIAEGLNCLFLGFQTGEVWRINPVNFSHTVTVPAGKMPAETLAVDAVHGILAVGAGSLNSVEEGMGEIDLYDIDTKQKLQPLLGRIAIPMTAAFSDDGNTISLDLVGRAVKWDLATGHTQDPVRLPNIIASSIGANSNRFAQPQPTGAIVTDLSTGQTWNLRFASPTDKSAQRNSSGPIVVISPNGKLLAVQDTKSVYHLFDVESGQELSTSTGWSAAFSGNSQLLLTATDDKTIKVEDISSKRAIEHKLDTPEPGITLRPCPVASSRDGSKTAIAYGMDILVFGQDPQQAPITLKGHSWDIVALAFNDQGSLLASASWDGTARVWDVNTATCKWELKGHTARVNGVAFRPNKPQLLTTGYDGRAILWNTNTGQEAATLFTTREGEGLAMLPDGTYEADKEALRAVSFVSSDDCYGFAVSDAEKDRPSAVLAALGSAPYRTESRNFRKRKVDEVPS